MQCVEYRSFYDLPNIDVERGCETLQFFGKTIKIEENRGKLENPISFIIFLSK